jgi:hypothetical protein
MLADTLTINDGSADKDFVKTKVLPDGSLRLDDATTSLEPQTLTIRHQVATLKGGGLVDRHLVQIAQTVLDDNQVAHTAMVNITIAVPRTAAIEVADVTKLVVLAINTVETRVAEITRGES